MIANKAPHSGDLLALGMQGIAELYQWREPATTERGDIAEEAMRQTFTALLIAGLFQQCVTEPLFETVDRLQRRPFSEVGREAFVLLGSEVVPMPSIKEIRPRFLAPTGSISFQHARKW